MCPDLLESLQVLPQLVLQLIGQDLRVLAVANVLLPVEEPVGDLVLPGVLHDRDHAINLGREGRGGGGVNKGGGGHLLE